jgi:hypothetical protein
VPARELLAHPGQEYILEAAKLALAITLGDLANCVVIVGTDAIINLAKVSKT